MRNYFSDEFEQVIHDSGMSARPGYYSGRGVTTSDVNSQILGKLHANIARAFGQDAAKQFVDLVAQVKELSATNFLMAMMAFDNADRRWDPAAYSYQAAFCQETNRRGDLVYDSEAEAFGAFASILGGSRHNDSRYSIAGAFLQQHGTREQVRGLQGDNEDSRMSLYGRFGRHSHG